MEYMYELMAGKKFADEIWYNYLIGRVAYILPSRTTTQTQFYYPSAQFIRAVAQRASLPSLRDSNDRHVG